MKQGFEFNYLLQRSLNDFSSSEFISKSAKSSNVRQQCTALYLLVARSLKRGGHEGPTIASVSLLMAAKAVYIGAKPYTFPVLTSI